MTAVSQPGQSGRLGRFIVASGLTNLADGIATVVWAWMASLLTRDPVLIALMPVALAEADLARICGLTLLALGRGLGVLAALGLVRHVNGVIEILSEPKLSAWLGPRAVPSAYAGGAADASNRRIA